MTLTEVIVGLTLLAILATSIIGITFQVRSKAEEAIYQNTSLTLAQGYMEQIRHLDYTTLRAVAQDSSSSVPLPLRNASGNAITPSSGTFFGNGTWSTETIYLDEVDTDQDGNNGRPIQPVTFRFRAVLTSLETALSGLASGVEVTIYYRTTYNFGVTRTHNGSLRSVRSSVPSY
jgi:type II secretory pathway pseudopilin PulG